MKRKGLWTFLCFLFVILGVVGCGKSALEICKAEVSETREAYYFARNDEFVASVTSGFREEEYLLNGEHTSLMPYTVLVVDFIKEVPKTLPKYELVIEGKLYSGVMELNPFNNTFCVDLGEKIDDGLSLVLKVSESDKTINLISVSNMWQVDYNMALDIAINAFGERIESHIEEGRLQGEIFQKLISLNKHSAEDVYWNVCFFAKNGEILTCTINVITGTVIAM